MKSTFSSGAILASMITAGVFGATPAMDRQAARLLDQASWGPTPSAITQVETLGLAGWINNQYGLNTSDLPDQIILNDKGNANTDLSPVRAVFFQNAVTGQDQLRQRIAFTLSQLWVVSQQEGVVYAYAYPPYWRVLRDSAFTNYADIIKNVTLNPAMGRYLNMANNNKGIPARGTSANENYGRELMQLFTLGLTQLNPDGSPVIVNGATVPTYAEAEVRDMAKALTGWTYPTAPAATARNNNPEYYVGQMFAVPADHDTSQKVLFGITIPANQTAEQDLASVISILMQQPTMAPFVGRQLIEHLVTSNPSPAYVQRVSTVFRNNGSGVAGDMKAVISAILLDSEARQADDPNASAIASAGHLREPILLMANLLRGLNASLGTANAINNQNSALGQNLFDAPSVFSYFSPASRTEKGLYGPEFQIYSTQTSSGRMNMIYNLIYGTLDSTTRTNLAPFNTIATSLPAATSLTRLVDYINLVFFHWGASASLQSNMLSAAQAAPSPARAVLSALYVGLTSSEYQVIH